MAKSKYEYAIGPSSVVTVEGGIEVAQAEALARLTEMADRDKANGWTQHADRFASIYRTDNEHGRRFVGIVKSSGAFVEA